MEFNSIEPTTSKQWNTFLKRAIHQKLNLLGLILGLLLIQTPKASGQTDSIHVAFAGGGWRAHTGHSAWIMSLLEANNSNSGCQLTNVKGDSTCLQKAFQNVKTISGNSGGSWFSTMLMYDTGFVNQITSSEAFRNWGDPDATNPMQGWLGKQQNIFKSYRKTKNDTTKVFLQELLFNYEYLRDIDFSFNWYTLVKNIVFEGYDWKNYGTLSNGDRRSWSEDKTLLLAGSWLTNSVVLNHDAFIDDKLYYQVKQTPFTSSDGVHTIKCGKDSITKAIAPDALPVTFTSLAKGISKPFPSFIGTVPYTYNLDYKKAFSLLDPVRKNTIKSQGIRTDGIKVIEAAAASSAAIGFAASQSLDQCLFPGVCDIVGYDCGFFARNLSLGFNLPAGTNELKFQSAEMMDNIAFDDLASERVLRIADGGAVDNSGVSQLVSYFQLNQKSRRTPKDSIVIVAFDDVSVDDAQNPLLYPSSDISNLFEGAKNYQICFEPGLCLTTPPLKILNLMGTVKRSTWYMMSTDSLPNGNFLHSYEYTGETVYNPIFNIDGGTKVILRVFASEFGCAATAPESYQDFDCYNNMLQSFIPALSKRPDQVYLIPATQNNPPVPDTSQLSGLTLLKQAFGLE